MLVLTRKLQQQIKIGDQITVTVLRVKGNTVRVGIQAPREVRVVRGELPKEGVAGVGPKAVTALADTAGEGMEEAADAGEEAVGGAVVSFRVKVAAGVVAERQTGMSAPRVETGTAVSGAHLPLRRIHDRFGGAPLKQVIAACNSLAK